jgi:hypothetical protein
VRELLEASHAVTLMTDWQQLYTQSADARARVAQSRLSFCHEEAAKAPDLQASEAGRNAACEAGAG